MGLDPQAVVAVTTTIIVNGTAGTAKAAQPFATTYYKKVIVNLAGYQNTGGTSQTITFPTPFTSTPYLAHDDSGGSTATTTTLTLPNSMASAKTGWIVVEGF